MIEAAIKTQEKKKKGFLDNEINKGYLAIPEKHDKPITSLMTAYAKELTLDKEQTSYPDSLDGLRLAIRDYKIE